MLAGLAVRVGAVSRGAGGRLPFLALRSFQFFPALIGEPGADVHELRAVELHAGHQQETVARPYATVELDSGHARVDEDRWRDVHRGDIIPRELGGGCNLHGYHDRAVLNSRAHRWHTWTASSRSDVANGPEVSPLRHTVYSPG